MELARIILCIALFVLFLATLIFAFVAHYSWDKVVHSIIEKKFVLKESGDLHHMFIKPAVPTYTSIYFWNWTNPYDFRDPFEKIELKEVGPYVFREETVKTDIVWNQNGTVSYRRKRYWYFEPSRSSGNLDDIVTTINIVAHSAAHVTENFGPITKTALNIALNGQKDFIQRPVSELLFEGTPDIILQTANAIPGFEKIAPFRRFGFFYKRNGTYEGHFNVDTGANGIEYLGMIMSWNYDSHTSYYDGKCGKIVGSAGDFISPKLTKEHLLEIFSTDACRSLEFNFLDEVESLEFQVPLYYFIINPSLFNNGYAYPSDKCYCKNVCPLPGAMDVSSCKFGMPAYLSFPHYLWAHSFYKDRWISGMKPSQTKHSSYIIVEPDWGVPFDVKARFQLNLLVRPHDDIPFLKGIKTIYFPLIWMEQSVEISKNLAKTVKKTKKITEYQTVVAVTSFILAFLIFLMFLWAAGYILHFFGCILVIVMGGCDEPY